MYERLKRIRMNTKKFNKWFLGTAVVALGMAAVSCEDEPDKFELTGGTPTIKFIRMTSPELADSLITSAYMENTICLVGENLTSIHELYFNDQKATLNTSYITKNTLIVDVPSKIPSKVSNKIFMINQDNDTTSYDFKVLVPSPTINSISCEWAKSGTIATITGNYFLDDENVPLTLTLADDTPVKITKLSTTSISFEVPDDPASGNLTVTSIYGSGRSKFQFHDTRNILFDWDGTRGGLSIGHGWRNGNVHPSGQDVEGIDGSYLYFGGYDLVGAWENDWAEDQFSFNYWPDPANGYTALSDRPAFRSMLNNYEISQLQLKFELYIPSSNPWSAKSMQIMFSSNDNVTYSNANNAYFSDYSVPRALWTPWESTGSYDTADDWVTVTIPLSDFIYDCDGGKSSGQLTKNSFTGLAFFVFKGGVTGTDCSPVMYIDNIRVVPNE